MRYIPGGAQKREQTIASVERVKARWAKWGASWWSFIERETGEVIGAGCIQHLRKGGKSPDPACPLEIGWRLRRDRWHRGFALEAAVAMAGFAFDRLRADLLLAVCQPENAASASVMKRLGMRYRGIETWYDRELTTFETTSAGSYRST